jgi:hypothetical protein
MFIEAIFGTKERFTKFVRTWYRVLIVKLSVAKCTNPSQARKITVAKISPSISFFFEPSYA